jgi:hypothetical protein
MFNTLSRNEALALKEFLRGIQTVEPSSDVEEMIGDLDLYLALDRESEKLAKKANSISAPEDPAKVWNQIFDLGEALAKLPASREEVLREVGEAQRAEIASKAHLDKYA